MADRLYGLTEDDLRRLKQLFANDRNRPPPRRGYEGKVDHEEQQAPETYVARTPDGGIPALTASEYDTDTGTGSGTGSGTAGDGNGTQPGYAECDVYRVIQGPTGDPELWTMPGGLSLRVHNLSGSAVAANAWVLVTRDKGGTWWAVTGGGAAVQDWRPGYVVSREDEDGTGTGTQASYTVQPIRLTSTGTWGTDGQEVSPCYRMPSSKYDEFVLIEIPDPETTSGGTAVQGVLWRPDPNEPGIFQMTPWGGLWKVVKKELVFSCTRCVETSPGLFEQITTNVYRKLAHFARDLRVTWKPPDTEEGPIEADLEETP